MSSSPSRLHRVFFFFVGATHFPALTQQAIRLAVEIYMSSVLLMIDILVWIRIGMRIRRSILWLMDPDPDPAIYVIDLQDANKKLIKKGFSILAQW